MKIRQLMLTCGGALFNTPEVTQKLRRILLSALIAGAGLFVGAQPALAQTGQETVYDGCMADIVDFGLNCTANDVRLSGVTNVIISDPCAYPGDEVTFSAEFETVLTAKERHDIGIYFSVDGDVGFCDGDAALSCFIDDECVDGLVDNGPCVKDGALTGACSISTVGYAPDIPWLDLDGEGDTFVDTNIVSNIQDTCGDIDSAHNPLYPIITVTATCIDSDGDGFLDLPYCTSWRQGGANDLCTGPLPVDGIGGTGLDSSGVTPGAPSKCKCDLGFNVPVPVPPAEINVTKTPDPTFVYEPGGPVTFTVGITNGGTDPNNPLTLESCIDDIFGNLFDSENPLLDETNTCPDMERSVPQGGSVSCVFTADVIGNVSDSPHVDTVICAGTDARNNPLTGEAFAEVEIRNVDPLISVVKEVTPASLPEPGGVFAFTVTVTNDLDVEDLTLNSLSDDVYGDLTVLTGSSCSVPQTLTKSGGSYTCGFTGTFLGIPGDNETDTVEAKAKDDEDPANEATATDDATVLITNLPSTITIVKTANGEKSINIDEPGENVTFAFTVTNTSATDWVTINSLTDTIYGDLNGKGNCAVPKDLAPNGGSFSCSFVALVEGNAGHSETNVVTASGVDDDGDNPEDAIDSATVTIDDVDPAAHLTKTVTKMVVTYEVEVFNDSTAEAVDVDALVDDEFGDLFTLVGVSVNDCNSLEGASIPVGESISCTFDAEVTDADHTNTVTATVSDDDNGDDPGNVVTPSPEASATVTFDPPTPTPPAP